MNARNANDHRIIWNIFRDHCPGADKGISADRDSAKDRGVGTDRGALLDQGRTEFIFPLDERAGVNDICEDTRRPAKNIVLDGHPGINGDVVLDLYAVAD